MFDYYSQTLFKSAQSLRFKTVKIKGSINYRTDLIQYLSIYLPPVLFFSMRTQRAVTPSCFKSIILRTGCALHRAVLSLSFYNTLAQWNIITVFLVLSYLSYVAALLLCYAFKKNIFKFYSIYLYVNFYLLVFSWMYFTIQRAMCDILPDFVIHLFTFFCKELLSFTRFYKTIVHPWFF